MKMKHFFIGVLLLLSTSQGVLAGGGGSSSQDTSSYYEYNDFLNALKEVQDQFYYDNTSYSANGDVAYVMPPAAPGSEYFMATIKTNGEVTIQGEVTIIQGEVRIKTPKVSSTIGDNDHYIEQFSLNQVKASDGDLLFVRCNGKGGSDGYGYFIHKYISSFTHVAIIYNKIRNQVIESTPQYGVALGNPTDYKKLMTYGTKRVRNATYVDRIKTIADRYKGKSYWPKSIDRNKTGKLDALREFFDINNSNSMYCSKFVYLVFRDYGINLASHRTKSWLSTLSDSSGNFVGITPDDIWGSDYTSPAIDFVQPDLLWQILDP